MKVLITAGGTHEYIDPVRYIGNASTGKMGIALAKVFTRHGYDVTLVLGATTETITNDDRLSVVNVVSAQDMYEACKDHADYDIIICAAAVADFRPKFRADHKIKKESTTPVIELEKTVDILFEIGKIRRLDQYLVGFALETDNGYKNAYDKMIWKNANMIILNSPSENTGFGHNTNKVMIISRYDEPVTTNLEDKEQIAFRIFEQIEKQIL